MRRFALPMGALYAAYVIVNLVLFNFRTPSPPDAGFGWYAFGITYTVVAIAVSVGTWRALANRRSQLA
jgi:hypothetical protein